MGDSVPSHRQWQQPPAKFTKCRTCFAGQARCNPTAAAANQENQSPADLLSAIGQPFRLWPHLENGRTCCCWFCGMHPEICTRGKCMWWRAAVSAVSKQQRDAVADLLRTCASTIHCAPHKMWNSPHNVFQSRGRPHQPLSTSLGQRGCTHDKQGGLI